MRAQIQLVATLRPQRVEVRRIGVTRSPVKANSRSGIDWPFSLRWKDYRCHALFCFPWVVRVPRGQIISVWPGLRSGASANSGCPTEWKIVAPNETATSAWPGACSASGEVPAPPPPMTPPTGLTLRGGVGLLVDEPVPEPGIPPIRPPAGGAERLGGMGREFVASVPPLTGLPGKPGDPLRSSDDGLRDPDIEGGVGIGPSPIVVGDPAVPGN